MCLVRSYPFHTPWHFPFAAICGVISAYTVKGYAHHGRNIGFQYARKTWAPPALDCKGQWEQFDMVWPAYNLGSERNLCNESGELCVARTYGLLAHSPV